MHASLARCKNSPKMHQEDPGIHLVICSPTEYSLLHYVQASSNHRDHNQKSCDRRERKICPRLGEKHLSMDACDSVRDGASFRDVTAHGRCANQERLHIISSNGETNIFGSPWTWMDSLLRHLVRFLHWLINVPFPRALNHGIASRTQASPVASRLVWFGSLQM